ncbi:MAG: LLM class flavin-dependent oxidoreductase [Chloroflexi bacterium]|nr:LLM class flavin-dependent oxidoreductase [Chloroflexota bacterium]
MIEQHQRFILLLNGLSINDAVAMAQQAEDSGLYAVGVDDIYHDPFTVLTAIAAVTSRIRLVTHIASWTRTPVTMARICRTLDTFSNGRLVLGLGSMPQRWNEDFHGIPWEAPLQRMREYVELVRRLWEATPETPVDYQGRFYRVSGFRVHDPPPRAHLPILIGASRPAMMRMTGKWADGVLIIWNHTIPWLKEVALPNLSEGARRSGRSLADLSLAVGKLVLVTDEPERARDVVRRHIAGIYLAIDYHRELLATHGFGDEVAAGFAALATGDMEGATRALSDRLVDTFAVIGSPEECRERMAEYSSVVDWVALSTPRGGMPSSENPRAVHRLIQSFGNT